MGCGCHAMRCPGGRRAALWARGVIPSDRDAVFSVQDGVHHALDPRPLHRGVFGGFLPIRPVSSGAGTTGEDTLEP